MNLEYSGNRLTLSNQSGFHHVFSALWLRESSTDPAFRDPKTGHKLGDGDALPLDLTISGAEVRGETLAIEFSDGHSAGYSLEWLKAAVLRPLSQELVGGKELWDAGLNPMPRYSLVDIKGDPAVLRDALNDIARLGFVIVADVPCELDGMREFIDLIGYMRVTNNGAIEDIKAIPPNRPMI